VFLQLFATTFAAIFVAELPDKTALTALVLATRYRPLPVFAGAGLALTVQSALAVVAGSLLARLPSRWVQIGAGLLFVGCAIVMWLRGPETADEAAAGVDRNRGSWAVFTTTFAMVFVAELGDLTQLGTAALQAKYNAWLPIYLGSASALWAVAAIAVFVGHRASRLFEARIVHKIAAVVFAVIGVILLTGVVR
jgi:Ca2+/H+ antiporter, TMEM165/GDT1 family